MNPLTVEKSIASQQVTSTTTRASSPILIPDNAKSMTIQVYKEPGSIVSGFYTVTVTTTTGQSVSSVVDGQTMVLMLGAYVSQNVEKGFVTLFDEVQKRNETIYAIQQLMPIIVDMQTKVPSGGAAYELTGSELATWQKYAALAGLPTQHQDQFFSIAEVPEILDLLQNNLSDQTRAGEQEMMKLNTQASLRATVYSLMQSNASAFKQALSSAAGS